MACSRLKFALTCTFTFLVLITSALRMCQPFSVLVLYAVMFLSCSAAICTYRISHCKDLCRPHLNVICLLSHSNSNKHFFYGCIIDNVGSFMTRLLYPEERVPGARCVAEQDRTFLREDNRCSCLDSKPDSSFIAAE